jgi:hypothetical protein
MHLGHFDIPANFARLRNVPALQFRTKGAHAFEVSYNGANFATPDDPAYSRIHALKSLATETAKTIYKPSAPVAWELNADESGGILACAWALQARKSIAFGKGMPSDLALAVANSMGVRIDYKEAPFAGTTLSPKAKAHILRARDEEKPT